MNFTLKIFKNIYTPLFSQINKIVSNHTIVSNKQNKVFIKFNCYAIKIFNMRFQLIFIE